MVPFGECGVILANPRLVWTTPSRVGECLSVASQLRDRSFALLRSVVSCSRHRCRVWQSSVRIFANTQSRHPSRESCLPAASDSSSSAGLQAGSGLPSFSCCRCETAVSPLAALLTTAVPCSHVVAEQKTRFARCRASLVLRCAALRCAHLSGDCLPYPTQSHNARPCRVVFDRHPLRGSVLRSYTNMFKNASSPFDHIWRILREVCTDRHCNMVKER